MKSTINWILLGVVVLLALVAWQQGGASLALQGLAVGGQTLWTVIPLLIAAFVLAGMVQALVSPELIERWLGSRSGWRGIALACVGGALMPGGPYAYYPIAAVLLKSGAGIGVLVAFVTAKNLWSVTRLPLEVALLGTQLTFIRVVVTFIFPPLLGFLAQALFGRFTESIRKGMPE